MQLRGPQPNHASDTFEGFARTNEYSILGLTHSADDVLVRRRRLRFVIILFGVSTITAFLYSAERYFYSRLIGDPVPLRRVIPTELLFTYLWALLVPAVMYVAKRYPVWGHSRRRNWAVQVAAMASFVIVHAALFSLASVAFIREVSVATVPGFFRQVLLSAAVLDGLVYCAIVAAHNAVIYHRASQDRALRASQLEAHLAQAQLHLLRIQLQPHFLFNTLHSISALMHTDVRRADSMIAALSDLLRMSLRHIGAQQVPLRSELEFLERYIEIMRVRFGDRLQITLDVDPNALDASVPNLFLQPLVENSLRHGLGDLGDGTITITVRRDGDLLRCDVADDGRGLSPGHTEGIGLSSTRQRLAHLYGERQSFSLHGPPGRGARVSMAIPFQHSDGVRADR